MKRIKSMTTFETSQPWVVYTYGLTHDLWWPPHNSTRWTGRSRIRMTCAVCGVTEIARLRIPRLGKIPDNGRHPVRVRFLREHRHPDRGAPMSWKMPMLNPEAHPGGFDLDALAMRIEADLISDHGDDGREES